MAPLQLVISQQVFCLLAAGENDITAWVWSDVQHAWKYWIERSAIFLPCAILCWSNLLWLHDYCDESILSKFEACEMLNKHKLKQRASESGRGCKMFPKAPVVLCADTRNHPRQTLMQTFSLHNQLFYTGSCKVNKKCFFYSQALQHTTYLRSRIPQAARRRAQSTASSVARRPAWPPATSAGTSASSISTCAHTLRCQTLNRISPYLSFSSLKYSF